VPSTQAARFPAPIAVCRASPAVVAGSNSIAIPASQVVTGSVPAWPPAGAVAATCVVSASPADGPDTAPDHAQVGVAEYVSEIVLAAGTTYVPAPVPTVTPPTITAVIVPPVTTTVTGNVFGFCTATVVAGLATRKSRSMTIAQTDQLLASGLSPWWRAWLTVAVRLGLRPGELGALSWADIAGGVLRVRHSLQETEDGLVIGALKTESSRRAMEMPAEVVTALAAWKREQAEQRMRLGPHWHDLGLVFTTDDGQPVNRQAVHRGFRAATKAAGIGVWQPRECRHTFVSTMSEEGADIEEISDAVGHVNSHITKVVYRHQIAEVVSGVARRMDARKQATS
jgi:Phage integrase family